MKATNIENTIVDEVNRRTYVILAPRVLTDGELYWAIRQEILRRGSPLADGETLTLTVTSKGGRITSVTKPEPQGTVEPDAVQSESTGTLDLPAAKAE